MFLKPHFKYMIQTLTKLSQVKQYLKTDIYQVNQNLSLLFFLNFFFTVLTDVIRASILHSGVTLAEGALWFRSYLRSSRKRDVKRGWVRARSANPARPCHRTHAESFSFEIDTVSIKNYD